MATKKAEQKPEPITRAVGMVKKGSLYYVVTLTVQGDKVLDTEYINSGDYLDVAQWSLRSEAGREFWVRIHKEGWGTQPGSAMPA